MTPLCAGRDPEWWSVGDVGNRLAIAICRQCSGCPDNDPKPAGVIRQGVPYTDGGRVLPVCPCGYPMPDPRVKAGSRCPRCALPGLDRWRSDVTRWAARGDTTTAMGRRLGFHRTTVRDALNRWARQDAAAQAPADDKTVETVETVDAVAVDAALAGDRPPLTDAERLEALRTGLDRGEPLRAVANALGLSYGKARDLAGLTAHRKARTAQIEAEVVRLDAAGRNDWQIANHVGIHHASVRRIRRRLAAREKEAA